MKNKIIKVKVPFNFYWTYGVTIEQFRKDLDDLEKLGVTEISMEAEEIWGSPTITISAFAERAETKEEKKERINKEKQRQEKIKYAELQQLEKLKLKYNM